MNPFAFVLATTTAAVVEPPPDIPKGTIDAAPASAGKTELEGLDEFATSSEVPLEDLEDVTELQLAAGGVFSTGNARSLAITGSGTFRLRRDIHQFGAEAAGNYARAAATGEDLETTVGNVQGRLRYDVFFHKRFSAFLMTTARHDPFQGLALRLNVDPGVAAYAIAQKKHRLWFEAGYDFQHDRLTEDATLQRDEDGNIIYDDQGAPVVAEDDVRFNHGARLFGGYINRLSDYVTFDTGLEYLQSFTIARRWRINWDSGLTTSLGDRFSFAARFTLRYDNDPAQAIEKLDTVTSMNLVVKVL